MYLNYVISIETKVLLSQAYVTTVDLLALDRSIDRSREKERASARARTRERERERENLVMRVELIY